MASPLTQRETIPFGRNSSHFVYIQNNLVEVLIQIKGIQDLSGKTLWVTCRLNMTGETCSPVFVGWVEDIQAIRRRVRNGHPHAPIDIRFGDTHPSDLYRECLSKPPGELVRRDWIRHQASLGSQEIGKNFYDETHRRSVPIKINDRSVGTLNAAFRGDPSSEDKNIQNILFDWAQNLNSDLVTYIEKNLDYSPKP